MQRYSMQNVPYCLIATLAVLVIAAAPCLAVPMPAVFVPDFTHCDGPTLTTFNLTHELGDGPATNPFPIDERIRVVVASSSDPTLFDCDPDDGIANDYIVRMQNLSPHTWTDLYFVTDEFGSILGQYDGFMVNPAFPSDPRTPAFRIDGTITPGVHNPLRAESAVADELFTPGEVWEFGIVNFNGGVPSFGSIGFGASGLPNPNSNASILANQAPIPEPASACLAIAGALTTIATLRYRWG